MSKLASVYKTDYVQALDQHSQTNLNSSWVNDKGTAPRTTVRPFTLRCLAFVPRPRGPSVASYGALKGFPEY